MLRIDIIVIISRQSRAFDHFSHINILINRSNHVRAQLGTLLLKSQKIREKSATLLENSLKFCESESILGLNFQKKSNFPFFKKNFLLN